MADVAAVKEKVQAMLADGGIVGVDRDGDFSVDAGSTRSFVRVRDAADGKITLVEVFAPILREVTPTADLWEYLARANNSWIFGHLVAFDRGETVEIMMIHHLLGDFLDREELNWAVYGIASAADSVDDELQAKFGGKRLSD